jgi:hypothetical protein
MGVNNDITMEKFDFDIVRKTELELSDFLVSLSARQPITLQTD